MEKNLKKCLFECQRCGYCCQNLGKSKTIPVFGFEIPELEKQAKKQKKALVFTPENMLLDRKSGQLFCLNYGLAIMPCPFLRKEKNKTNLFGCSIYDYRPLICRKFPLEKNPFFHDLSKSMFFDCDYLNPDKILKFIKNKTGCLNNLNKKPKIMKKEFIGIFGKETWDASLKIDGIKYVINSKLEKLEREGKIDIVSMDWIDVNKYKNIIDVFEFLKKQKYLNKAD